MSKTINVVEFYYAEEVALFEPDFIAAQQAAYMETCVGDDEIGVRMDAGRRALYAEGRVEVGPYQSPMEDGMQHFHEWYRATMARLRQGFEPAKRRGDRSGSKRRLDAGSGLFSTPGRPGTTESNATRQSVWPGGDDSAKLTRYYAGAHESSDQTAVFAAAQPAAPCGTVSIAEIVE